MSRIELTASPWVSQATCPSVLRATARRSGDRSKPQAACRTANRRAAARLATLLAGAAILAAFAAPVVAEHTALSADSSAAAAVREQLSALLAQVPSGTQVGLVVADSHDAASWFARQPKLPLKPASLSKLFVTAAALERFGPDFTYQTRLYMHDDELWVIGSGDPGLGDERIARRHDRPLHDEFDVWARLLRDRGITSLSNIALDDTVFERPARHPDWPPDQNAAWYQAPVGGINFNDNCLDAHVTVSGGVVELNLRPHLPASFFCSTLEVSSKHAPLVKRGLHEDVFQFSGTVAHADQFEPVSVGRPTVAFGHALRQALEERGVTVTGHVVRREIKPTALAGVRLLDARVTGLRDVLWRTNTFSQNLFAECLLKSLAAYNPDGSRSGMPGSWEGGVAVLRATLQELGIALDGAIFRDGSGLSHENRVTAEQIVQLLVTMRHHRHSVVFIESLAQPGEDGTLRRRYATPALRDHLRAKTGTLKGVRTLAGYVTRSDGVTLVFALLINGHAPRTLPTQVAETLVQAGVDE